MAATTPTRQIRREMRERRRSLSRADQQHASLALARLLVREPLFLRSKRIALYLAQDGEIDPLPLLNTAADLGKRCYLPHLQPDPGRSSRNLLWFLRYAPGDPLAANRFGIPEPIPRVAERIRPQVLDLVLLPLVAFDGKGNRVGMGRGYYDQTFAFTRSTDAWHRPRLIGLAHECQRVAKLARQPWDVPLDGVATDKGVCLFAAKENIDDRS